MSFFKPLPQGVFQRLPDGGRVERVDYIARARDGRPEAEKHAWVYLPRDYDPKKRYDVLYFLHGGGENAESMFFTNDEKIPDYAAVLDNLMASGAVRPFLAVTPTYYSPDFVHGDLDVAREHTLRFPREFEEDLIPAVESRYSTWTESFDRAGLAASAPHRAVGGFSMGSVCMWNCFLQILPCFGTFLPLSGDCWIVERFGGASHPQETAQAIAEAARTLAPAPGAFSIWSATGTKDTAFKNLGPQMDAMRALKEFAFAPKEEGGNVFFEVEPEGMHQYRFIYQYLWNLLPRVFPPEG